MGLHFEDDFQLDRRPEWKTRGTKDEVRRESLFAEDISKQLWGQQRNRQASKSSYGNIGIDDAKAKGAIPILEREPSTPLSHSSRFDSPTNEQASFRLKTTAFPILCGVDLLTSRSTQLDLVAGM